MSLDDKENGAINGTTDTFLNHDKLNEEHGLFSRIKEVLFSHESKDHVKRNGHNELINNRVECFEDVSDVDMENTHALVDCVMVRKDNVQSMEDDNVGIKRETWNKKMDFLLSVIGFAVDLSNIWRFPYICFKNGGGAFLIPYFLMLIFLGLPIFYLELAIGQFHRCGTILIWKKICPMFTGVGFASCLVALYVGMYYNTIIAWALYYVIASCRSQVPWASCNNSWNTPNCISVSHIGENTTKLTNISTPSALEFFHFNLLESEKSTGIDDIGPPKWTICLCLLAVMATVYFCLWKGIKSSGKAVWITATFPYIVMVALLIRGCTLPGAKAGILYYLTPVWRKLLHVPVWIDAAAQIFFSLGPGFGTLIALSSYNKYHSNCYKDALITASINCLTSLLAGFVVFSVLGYLGYVLNKSIDELAIYGPGLVFNVYPEALATLHGSVFWSILFFLLLISLGLDSTFGGLESLITAVCDICAPAARRREVLVLVIVSICFIGAIPTTTYGGQFVVVLFDTHAAPVALIFICFVETAAVSWFYGVQRFSNDIEEMLGFQPSLFWKICWAIVCPVGLFALFILSIFAYEGLELDGYKFPFWSEVLGWMLTMSSLICIPVYVLYSFWLTPGDDIKTRFIRMITPGPVKPSEHRALVLSALNQEEHVMLNGFGAIEDANTTATRAGDV